MGNTCATINSQLSSCILGKTQLATTRRLDDVNRSCICPCHINGKGAAARNIKAATTSDINDTISAERIPGLVNGH